MELAGVGVDVRRLEDTGTVGRNTTIPSLKPSNSQPSQNGSYKKSAEDKGTDKGPIKVKYGDHYTKDGRRKVLKENILLKKAILIKQIVKVVFQVVKVTLNWVKGKEIIMLKK